ncbi:hypothetical protein, partial [Oleiphilus sp. HI0125]
MSSRISLFSQKLKAVKALGLVGVARAVVYRVSLLSGLNPVKRLNHSIPEAPFFKPSSTSADKVATLHGNTQWDVKGPGSAKSVSALCYFGSCTVPYNSTNPPNWFYDPFSKTVFEHTAKPWWLIPDFVEPGRDIKSTWELSRFDWVIPLSQRAAREEGGALEQLNIWL